jgi:hypothetical protein
MIKKQSTDVQKSACLFSSLLLAALIALPLAFSASVSEARSKKTVKKRKGMYALYQDASLGMGPCLPPLTEKPDTILSRNGINVDHASADEKAALAKGVAQVERLFGDPLPIPWRINFQFVNGTGKWNSGLSRPNYVTVRRQPGSPKGLLVGRMMHELGHRVGGPGGGYGAYQRYVKGNRCAISPYSKTKLNEEFAEVFEAYVVKPDFLEQKCPQSYRFMKEVVFKNPDYKLANCSNPGSVLANKPAIKEDIETPEAVPLPTPAPRVSSLGGSQ